MSSSEAVNESLVALWHISLIVVSKGTGLLASFALVKVLKIAQPSFPVCLSRAGTAGMTTIESPIDGIHGLRIPNSFLLEQG